jgi:alpha-1,2-mannosyltransferase
VVWAAAVAILAVTLAPILVWWLTNPPDQRMVDLEVYRDGGRAVLRGGPLYEVLTQPPQLLPFTYPPFASLLAVPFTVISWKAAQWLWMALLYAALAVAVWYAFRPLIRRAGHWAPVAMATLIGAMAWLMPVFDQARFGQVGVFLMALCLADCVPERTYWPRGMLVGLAVAIKLVPGVFLIYFLITGRREALGNAVLTAGAATLAGFAMLYLPDPLGTLLWLVLAAIVAYWGFRMARRATLLGDDLVLARPGSRDRLGDAYTLRLAAIAIVGLLSVLLSPVGWIHHLVWMVPVLGALIGDGTDTPRRRIAIAVWIGFLFPLPWWGAKLISLQEGLITKIPGKIVQDAFGLAAVGMVALLGGWLAGRLATRAADRADASRRPAEVDTLGV